MAGEDAAVDQVREALPGYEVSGLLGRGAMGEVLAGRHLQLDRPVAVKRLPAAFAADPEVRARFGQEARTLAGLTHPHIVPVYDYVERDGLCLLVMEALPGGTVWDRFTGAGVAAPTACAVTLATCAGLTHAHAKQVLHRDVKPDNLMFDAEGGLKVTDFGIATVFGGEETLATVTGEVVGTPAYMAPEQAAGDAVGPAADVYATATMLYELLAGHLPFRVAEEPQALLRARLEQDPVPLLEAAPTVPAALSRAVMDGLERRPEDRPPGAEAFGVAVARAATEAWGPGWQDASEVHLLASGPVAAALEAGPATDDVAAGGERTTAVTGTARPTRLPGEGGDDGDEGAAATIGPGVAQPVPVERVRATSAPHAGGVDLAEVDRSDLVSVRDLVQPPPTPWAALAVTAALLVTLVLVALGALGGPTREQVAEPGQVRVAGVDVGRQDTVPIDLGSPIVVRVADLPGPAASATEAELALTAMGLPIGTSNRQPLEPGDRGRTARVSATSSRLVSSGTVTGELRLLDAGGRRVFATEFGVEPDQPPLVSAFGVLAVLLTVGGLAYGIGQTRALRSGRRRFVVQLGPAGALVGAGLVLLAWSAGGPEPTVVAVVLGAVLGATAALVGGWALGRQGRARRIRRARRIAGAA